MGLLNIFDSEDGQQALGLLAAASARSDGAGFGQRLSEAVGHTQKWKQQQAAQEEARQMAEYRKQQMAMQAMQMQEAQAKMAREKEMQGLAQQFYRPGSQAISPLVGDSDTGIMPSQGRPAVAPSFDARGFGNALMGAGHIDAGRKELAALQKENQINKLDAKDFTPASVQKFQQSGNYGDLVRLDKAHFANVGGQTVAADPFTGRPLNSIQNTQSPDSIASNQTTMRGQNLTNARGMESNALTGQRLAWDMNGGGEGGASQAGLNKQFGKPQAGYRWKADGSLEFIPGGPADQKAQLQKVGEGTVAGVVADLRDKYSQLDQENGIVSTNNRAGTNLGAAFGSSGVGQTLNGMFGTKTQSARDSIVMTRPLLLQAIMKATGMSAKQIDSNAELKLYLSTATDPQKLLEANIEALNRIESLFGGGGGQKGATQKQPAAMSAASIPQGAISKLKMQPALRDAFDAKYGPGAAAQILGN